MSCLVASSKVWWPFDWSVTEQKTCMCFYRAKNALQVNGRRIDGWKTKEERWMQFIADVMNVSAELSWCTTWSLVALWWSRNIKINQITSIHNCSTVISLYEFSATMSSSLQGRQPSILAVHQTLWSLIYPLPDHMPKKLKSKTFKQSGLYTFFFHCIKWNETLQLSTLRVIFKWTSDICLFYFFAQQASAISKIAVVNFTITPVNNIDFFSYTGLRLWHFQSWLVLEHHDS